METTTASPVTFTCSIETRKTIVDCILKFISKYGTSIRITDSNSKDEHPYRLLCNPDSFFYGVFDMYTKDHKKIDTIVQFFPSTLLTYISEDGSIFFSEGDTIEFYEEECKFVITSKDKVGGTVTVFVDQPSATN